MVQHFHRATNVGVCDMRGLFDMQLPYFSYVDTIISSGLYGWLRTLLKQTVRSDTHRHLFCHFQRSDWSSYHIDYDRASEDSRSYVGHVRILMLSPAFIGPL
jgi:hypothetical protein